MKFSLPTIRNASSAIAFLVLVATAFGQNTQPKWMQGDIFLGVGSGQWKVFRLSSPSQGSVVDSFSDGLNGATNGSAIDNTWHLVTTDSGSAANLSNVVRFRVSPNDPTNNTPVTPVLSVFNSGGGTATNPKSVAIDGFGNTTVANANPATIVKLSPTGSVLATVPIPANKIDKALASADLGASGSVLYYTSGGATIGQLSPISAAGTISTFASLSGKKLFGIRVVPPGGFPSGCSFCPSGGGFLVAANSAVLLLNSAGTLIHTYTISGQNSLQVVALDPLVQNTAGNKVAPSSFWVSSPGSNLFFHVDFATGLAQQFSVSGASGIASIATYAGLSANQSVPTAFPEVTMTGNPSNSGTFFFANADQLTLTGYGFPSGFSTTLSVFASAIDPAGGASDTGQPCTPTVSGKCTVWSVDVDPPLGSSSLISMKILATQNGVGANTRVVRDSREDVTTAVANIDPVGRSLFSTYTLNEVSGTDQGCTYLPPVGGNPPVVLNSPGNITFRFTCSRLSSTQLAALQPRISIVQTFNGAAPEPFFPGITDLTGGTCCTIAKYRFDTNSNTWVINVSFKGATGNFIATTFDDSSNAFKPSSFYVTFSVQ